MYTKYIFKIVHYLKIQNGFGAPSSKGIHYVPLGKEPAWFLYTEKTIPLQHTLFTEINAKLDGYLMNFIWIKS